MKIDVEGPGPVLEESEKEALIQYVEGVGTAASGTEPEAMKAEHMC